MSIYLCCSSGRRLPALPSNVQVFTSCEDCLSRSAQEPPLFYVLDLSLQELQVPHIISAFTHQSVVLLADAVYPESYPVLSALSPFAILPWNLFSGSSETYLAQWEDSARKKLLKNLCSAFLAALMPGSFPENKFAKILKVFGVEHFYVICLCPSAGLLPEHRRILSDIVVNSPHLYLSVTHGPDDYILADHTDEAEFLQILDAFRMVDPQQEYGIGVSLCLTETSDLYTAGVQAKRATEYNFYEKKELNYYTQGLFSESIDYMELISWEKNLTNAILSGYSEPELATLVEGYCDYFRKARLLPELAADSVYRYLNSLDRVFKFIDPLCSIDLSFITLEQIINYGTLQNLHAALLEMLLDFLRRGEHYNKSTNRLIDEICTFIDDNLGAPLSLAVVEEKFYVNKFVFCRQFKKHTGLTFNEYIRLHRLEKAKELLRKTNIRVYEIASQLGFKDEAYFSSVFKKEYGISPSAWRAAP